MCVCLETGEIVSLGRDNVAQFIIRNVHESDDLLLYLHKHTLNEIKFFVGFWSGRHRQAMETKYMCEQMTLLGDA